MRDSGHLGRLPASAFRRIADVQAGPGQRLPDRVRGSEVARGGGPPDKYQTTGRIDSTDWSTGQPKTDVNVIVCTHIQVVYSGINTTSPSTCAQTTFS